MCYINIENFFSIPTIKAVPLLFILRHASKKDVSEWIEKLDLDEKFFRKLEEEKYIKFIKGTKKQTILQRMRLDTKGANYLNLLDEPVIEEEDKKFGNWLITLYKSKGKTIKSGKKLLRLISWFREATNIDRNKLGYLLKCFIEEQEETDFKYSHDVNNIFWKPTNLFQTKPSLEDSRLYSFYLTKKEKFDKMFEKL